MSHRRHDAGYHHRRPTPEERELGRWQVQTCCTMPSVSYEDNRTCGPQWRAREEFIAARRAQMPQHLKELLAKKVGEAKAEADARERGLPQADAEKLASLTDRAAKRAAAKTALRALREHERLLSVSERAAARAARKALRDAQRSAERDARRAEEGPKARNGKASIAHLTPEQKRERKLEQTRMSNRRKRAERKAALSAANVTFVQQSLA